MVETILPRAGAASRVRPEISALAEKIARGEAKLGIIGLGYVGMPLALTGAKAGFNVLGFDINAPRIAQINRGESFLSHIPSEMMRDAIASGKLEATSDFARLSEPDAILI
ncbi:MAG: nucleotide sugar dehydrogenase, partial [Acetobacteraceae bacterium]|nr:nucleotide sugar dehydrogenase [Acetobacteraceae bacterium]